MTPALHRCSAIALAVVLAALPRIGVGADEAKPTAKPPAPLTGVQRAQRCMEIKNRRADEKAADKGGGKAAKPSPTVKPDLDWYQKHCK